MLNLSIYQIFLVIISSLFLWSAFSKFIKKEKGYTFLKFLITIVIWGGILFFSLFPDTARLLSQKLGMGESLNTFIFLGFVIVFLIIFKLINIIQRIERNISEIVRKEALKKIEKK